MRWEKQGGEVVLPAMELVLDRGLILRSGVELCWQGEQTVLVKGLGKIYPLSGYHNLWDVRCAACFCGGFGIRHDGVGARWSIAWRVCGDLYDDHLDRRGLGQVGSRDREGLQRR